MLISHRFKFIYTKTAKTGGTSVESYFEKYCMKEDEWVFSHVIEESVTEYGIIGYRGKHKNGSQFFNHMPAAMIKELIGDQIWKEYFKFCVIRNPYDKVISAFFHFDIYKNNISGTKKQLIERFRNYIKCGKGLLNDRDKYVIDNKLCLDDYIRTENMLIDLHRICIRLGIQYAPNELTRLKSGFKPPDVSLLEYFDKETDEIIRKHFAFEFENFGYSSLYS